MNELAGPGAAILTLRLGHACYRNLAWECVAGTPGHAVWLADALPGHGYVESSDSPLVRLFDHRDGHSVVVVPRTGRIQIRVHYLTPPAVRAEAAQAVARELEAALRSASAVASTVTGTDELAAGVCGT